jgi:hypothetical protein
VSAVEREPYEDDGQLAADETVAEYLEVSVRLSSLADRYEDAYGPCSQTSGALRRAAGLLATATQYLPRPERCRLPGCNKPVEQPDGPGRPALFCGPNHTKAYSKRFGRKQKKDDAPGMDPSVRSVRQRAGKLPGVHPIYRNRRPEKPDDDRSRGFPDVGSFL